MAAVVGTFVFLAGSLKFWFDSLLFTYRDIATRDRLISSEWV